MSDLTEAEEHYLKTGGDVTDALVNENKDTPVPAPEKPAVEGAPAQPEQAPATAETEAPDTDDDEPVVAGQSREPRRRISRKEYESERQARLEVEKKLQDLQIAHARGSERLNILQQALQTPPQEEAPAEVPDPEKDIFAYVRHLESTLNAVTSKVNTYEEQINQGQREMENEQRYFSALNDYAGTKPDFVHAYNYLLRSRAAELTARQYQVTEEQLQGIMDGRVRVPQPIANALRQEERDLYRTAFEQNRDPGATIYQYATMRGYRTPAAAPAPAAPAAGAPGTPLGGAQAAPARSAAAPTATDVVQSIQKGKEAATSLSNAGGTAADTQLTAKQLAEMSEEQFATLYNELMAKGDKSKLMDLMGH